MYTKSFTRFAYTEFSDKITSQFDYTHALLRRFIDPEIGLLRIAETEREIMDTVRSRQKRWLGHILKQDSLLRITLEGQIHGKKAYGRPRTMRFDWLLKTEEDNSYEELKMSAQDRSRWSQWRCKPAMAEHWRYWSGCENNVRMCEVVQPCLLGYFSFNSE